MLILWGLLASNKSLLAHKISIDKDNLAIKFPLEAFNRELWFWGINLEKNCLKVSIQEKIGAKECSGEEESEHSMVLT